MWTSYVLLICYTVGMDKAIRLLKKVQADVAFHKGVIRNESDPALVQVSRDLLKQNQAWLAEWKAQAELTASRN